MINQITVSQLNLYLFCSLKYKFQYIDKVPKSFKSSCFIFSSAIYSTLSWFHKERRSNHSITLERLHKIFLADWYSQKVETDIHYKDGETNKQLKKTGKEILGLYFKNPLNAIDNGIEFNLPITNPCNNESSNINLKGFIDFIENDDTIVVFKVSSSTMKQEDVDSQLKITTHSYAYEMLYGKPPKLLKLSNLVKAEKPEITVFETKRYKADYQRLFYIVNQVLKAINANIFFPKQSFMCWDCEYVKQCKTWEGN